MRQRNAVIGGIIVAIVVIGLLAPWLATKPIDATDLLNAWAPPGGENLLGTDKLGRDSLSRLIAGRTLWSSPARCWRITLTLGTLVGMISGYVGGKVDAFLMRIVDATLALPGGQ